MPDSWKHIVLVYERICGRKKITNGRHDKNCNGDSRKLLLFIVPNGIVVRIQFEYMAGVGGWIGQTELEATIKYVGEVLTRCLASWLAGCNKYDQGDMPQQQI